MKKEIIQGMPSAQRKGRLKRWETVSQRHKVDRTVQLRSAEDRTSWRAIVTKQSRSVEDRKRQGQFCMQLFMVERADE